MAIRIQKAPALAGEFEYISKQDEAVDKDCEDFKEKWQRYVDGAEDPPLKQGQEPTVWKLRPITDATLKAKLSDVIEKDGINTAAVAYAAHGLVGVKNLADAEGRPYEFEYDVRDGYRSVKREQLSEIGLAVLIELGVAVLNHDSPN